MFHILFRLFPTTLKNPLKKQDKTLQQQAIILIEVSSFRNRQPYLVSIVRNICDWCFLDKTKTM